MILGIRLIGIVFCFSMIYFAVLHFKKQEIGLFEISMWIAIWVFTVITILFPDIIQPFAKNFLFARLLDMLIVGAFVVVFIMTAKAYITARKLEKKLENLVRKETFKNATDKER